MSSASRLPEKLLKRWKAASKEGQRALTAFVKFSTEPLESVQQFQRITSTKAKIMQSVEECNIICDELGSALFCSFFIFSSSRCFLASGVAGEAQKEPRGDKSGVSQCFDRSVRQ
jgi:hypothetical protein